MGFLGLDSHWCQSVSARGAECCLGGWILLCNPLISWEVICCWPGRTAKPRVEGQIKAPDIQSNHIYFYCWRKKCALSHRIAFPRCPEHSQGIKTLQIVCVRFILIVYLTMKVLATQLLEMSQLQTDDQTPWWPVPAPTGQSSRTTISWLWCMWGSHSMWTYLQNSTLEINDKYARASLFAWKKHGTGNEELQPVWPPNNGLQPEPIQSLKAGFPPQEHFLSNTHMHMFTQTKAFPALCSGWAIIVCLVQLHLKWQWPRALGGD